MAFIPDEAFDRASEISKTAFVLYCYICRWRNHKHRNAILNHSATAHTLALSRSQIYRNLAELKSAGWIVARGDFIAPMVGDFSIKNRPLKQSHKCDTPSQICDEKSQICDNAPIYIPALNTSLNGNSKISQEKTGRRKTFAECPNRCTDGYYSTKYSTTTEACHIHWSEATQEEKR